MKKLLTLLFMCFSLISDAQTIEKSVQLFWEAFEINENKEIIKYGHKIIQYIEDNAFVTDSNTIVFYIETANAYANQGDDSASLNLNKSSYEKAKLFLGGENTYSIIILNNLALDYSNLGDYQKSKELNEQCLIIREKIYGKEHPSYIISLSNLASNNSDLGDYSKSKELNEQCLIIREKIFGKDHIDYATSLHNLALNYSNLGDYQKSKELNKQCSNIYEKLYGKDHPDYAISLSNLASNNSCLGDYQKSKELNEQCLIIYEKLYGKDHPDYAAILNNLALDYSDLGNYSKSKELNEHCSIIYKKLYGKGHPKYTGMISQLAVNYSNLGDYQKSKELNEQCLIFYEKLYGKEHPNYATSLNNLALNYYHLGEHEKSLELNLHCLKIKEKLFGKEHNDYASSLNNLALNYSHLGDYQKSKELNEQCLKIKEKLFGKEHPDYVSSLGNLASNYSNLGDYQKAKELNLKCLNIAEKSFGKSHPFYVRFLNDVALNYSNLGDYQKSKELIEQCLKISEKIYGREHPFYAINLNNLALNYSELGDYQKSKELNLKCLFLTENIFGKTHSNYSRCLSNLASNYSDLGDYSKSKKLNLQCLNINEKIYGKGHPVYALSLNNLAWNYFRIGDYISMDKSIVEYLNISWQTFMEIKFGLNPRLQTEYKNICNSDFQSMASLYMETRIEIPKLNNYWININGIICSEQERLKEYVLLSQDTSLIKIYNNLIQCKSQLAKWNEMTIQDRKPKEINTVELEKEIELIESELSKKSELFESATRKFRLKDVISNLSSEEAIVDIIRKQKYNFSTNQWTDSTQYLVFISDSKDTLVDFVVIEDGTTIDQIVFDLYKQQASDIETKTDLNSDIFYNSFWKPIADKIGDAKTIYVSLGGVYNNINLNTLYNPETGKYLIEEKDIRIVNSARDFVLSKEQEKKIYTTNTASLFGFPDFNGNTTVAVDSTDFLASTRDLNSFWLDSLTRGGLKVNPLPATKIEVENISLTLKSKGWQVNSFLADNASETNIKKQESPRILHIATHGYFFPDVPMEKDNTRFLGMDRQQVVQDPMLRSGLLFTGANRTLKGEETKGENGLLSAAEASLLDLRETELVILSACETGKGEVKNSEGVYGLRKAFSDAGAKNIIMSLWKVDDKVTQEFMSRFYEIWLNDKTSIREAFNKTQLEIKAKYPEPYYWGAFILVGE
jgi:CHAT domain-containing protein